MKHQFWAYKLTDGRLLAIMENNLGPENANKGALIIGAVSPGIHGDYYKEIIIGARDNAKEYLEFISGPYVFQVHPEETEFTFKWSDVTIVKFEI